MHHAIPTCTAQHVIYCRCVIAAAPKVVRTYKYQMDQLWMHTVQCKHQSSDATPLSRSCCTAHLWCIRIDAKHCSTTGSVNICYMLQRLNINIHFKAPVRATSTQATSVACNMSQFTQSCISKTSLPAVSSSCPSAVKAAVRTVPLIFSVPTLCLDFSDSKGMQP